MKAGALPLDVSVVLNAGLLALTAPGGDRLELVAAKKNIYGKQAVLAGAYGETWQLMAPAREYIIHVRTKDGTDKTMAVTITAGERAELTIP